ncbi:hypothetical protein LEP1GSC193_1935 [Leptospira alstonii serovar Pingchang str. 80-412]|uniref:Uncharacterized protein n=1 Tax=Leptospira alstonii serovar Pingchang str. 80-412 TaxID=1218564 RepID=T0G5N2_9LEPT|nr:hypothetical protein LEP1GSC193_1935 [Leptospira alstonii serovar Pingchang str. 80-412]
MKRLSARSFFKRIHTIAAPTCNKQLYPRILGSAVNESFR